MAAKKETSTRVEIPPSTIIEMLCLFKAHRVLVINITLQQAREIEKKPGWSYIYFQAGECRTIPTRTQDHQNK